MKRGRVDFDSCSCRNQESFDLRCVICKIVFNILLASEKQYKVCHCHVDLGIPVIFHCVQLFVVAVAVSDLNGKSAESLIGQRLLYFQRFQFLHRGHIDHVLRNGSVLHLSDKRAEIIPLQHLSVFAERSVCYILDFHPVYLLKTPGNLRSSLIPSVNLFP